MPIVLGAGWSFSPLDEELGLVPGRFTPRLLGKIVRVGATVSFAEARQLLAELVGVEVPAETVRRVTEGAGRRAVEVETRQAEGLGKSLARPVVSIVDRLQQVSVDGAMVPLVKGEWAEAKTLAIGRVERGKAGPKARDLSYFSRLADYETFSDQARVEFWRRGTEEAREVVAVTDGAEWIQRLLDDHCPDALRIIDWGHAASYISTAGQALFGQGTADCSAWMAAQRETLWNGEPALVIERLAQLEGSSGLDEVRIAHQYLAKRCEQLRYAAFRSGGYPVGSGIVESANKAVVEARLKGRGKHWARANVNPILALRCAQASNRWRECWSRSEAALRRPHCHRPLRPLSLPQPAPPPVPIVSTYIPTIVNGKPTRHHPWKR